MRSACQFFALFVMLLSMNAVAVELIQTVAGNGANTNFAASGTATALSIFPEGDAAIDDVGNVYFSDPRRSIIFKFDGSDLTPIAGTGTSGFSGDGNLATNAQFCKPAGLSFATIYVSPNTYRYLYVADAGNHRIRRIDLDSNIITTVAGTGTAGYSDGGGVATNAMLNSPRAVAARSDGAGTETFFIADTMNHRVRRVNAGNISTFAGNGTSGFSDGSPGQLNKPTGLSILNNSLYIADSENHRIRKIPDIFTTPSINTVVGTGTRGFSGDGGGRLSAQLANPCSVVAVDADHIYIADTGNHRIRVFDDGTLNNTIATFAGNGQPQPGFGGDGNVATSAGVRFNMPSGVTANASYIYITDEGNFRIRKVDSFDNTLTTIAGNGLGDYTGDGGAAMSASFRLPQGVFVDATNNIYIADTNNHRVRKIDTTGNISTVAGNGNVEFIPDSAPLHQATNTTVPYPQSVFVDKSGQIFIANDTRIRRVRADGYIETITGDVNGQNGYSGDGGNAANARLNNATSVIGGDNCLLILDSGNFRIRKIDLSNSNNIITTIAGNGTFGYSGDNGQATNAQISYARGFCYDVSTKSIYIADTGNHRIRKIDASGIITTIAGTGISGFSGDNGLAIAAQLNAPLGVAITMDGTLYITEEGNFRVRKIAPSGIITTVTGNGVPGFDGDPDDTVKLASLGRVRYASAIVSAQKGVYFTDTYNNKLRLISNNFAPIISAVQVSQDPVKVGMPVTFTVAASDPENDALTYTWNAGDGSPLTSTGGNNSVTHTFTAEGVYTGMLAVADTWQNTTGSRPITVIAPNSGGSGVPNVAHNNPLNTTVANPLNGLSISIVSSDGGVIELYVDVNAMIREAYSVSTDFDGSLGRVATATGVRPIAKLTSSEIYVATSVANEIVTGLPKGKARKMLVVSRREVGQNQSLTDNRSSTDIIMSKLKGKFNFKSNSASLVTTLDAVAVKKDTVTFSGKIHLPGGLDFSQEQDAWIGIGNIVDHVTLGPKAKAKLPSDKGIIKKFHLRYPKLTNMITVGDEIAKVDFTINQEDLSTTGFDTEGVSVEVTGADKTPVARQIQVGMLLSGMAYQSSVTAQFKTRLNKATNTPISGDLTGSLGRTGQ